MNKSDKVFITGAEGFIGSHLVEALVHQGVKVKALVLYNSFSSIGWLKNLPLDIKKEIEIVFGDVRDMHCMQQYMKGCNKVFHLAALIGIPYSYVAPDSYVDVNIKGTLNVLQAARNLDVEKIVHTSTSEVYGSAQFVPIHEDHPLVGQSPYAATKIAADQLALSFYRTFQLPVAIARPFNTYGPRQSTRAVIPTIITQALSGVHSISLGATDTTRDFNYCLDTALGLIAIMDARATIGEVVNIGSGFEIAVAELVNVIAELVNVKINVKQDELRIRPQLSEVERLCADNTKIRNLTKWQPKFADLEGLKAGLEHTIKWFQIPENLAHYQVGEYAI